MQGRDDRSRAATKAAIVHHGNTRSMVSKFGLDFGVCDEGRRVFWLNGNLGFDLVEELDGSIRKKNNKWNVVTAKYNNLLGHDP